MLSYLLQWTIMLPLLSDGAQITLYVGNDHFSWLWYANREDAFESEHETNQ